MFAAVFTFFIATSTALKVSKQFKHMTNTTRGQSIKTLNLIFGSLAVAFLITAAYVTFSHHPIAVKLNVWQTKMTGDNTYFPALTIFIIALPPLLLLLMIKKIVLRIFHQ